LVQFRTDPLSGLRTLPPALLSALSRMSAVASPVSPNPEHVLRLAAELNLKVFQIAATAQLFAEGATVPFIARYRKEVTGELDEVQVLAIRDRLEQLRAMTSFEVARSA